MSWWKTGIWMRKGSIRRRPFCTASRDQQTSTADRRRAPGDVSCCVLQPAVLAQQHGIITLPEPTDGRVQRLLPAVRVLVVHGHSCTPMTRHGHGQLHTSACASGECGVPGSSHIPELPGRRDKAPVGCSIRGRGPRRQLRRRKARPAWGGTAELEVVVPPPWPGSWSRHAPGLGLCQRTSLGQPNRTPRQQRRVRSDGASRPRRVGGGSQAHPLFLIGVAGMCLIACG